MGVYTREALSLQRTIAGRYTTIQFSANDYKVKSIEIHKKMMYRHRK